MVILYCSDGGGTSTLVSTGASMGVDSSKIESIFLLRVVGLKSISYSRLSAVSYLLMAKSESYAAGLKLSRGASIGFC